MKKPHRVFAPFISAGITVGFLASAYKFVIAKSGTSKEKSTSNSSQSSSVEAANSPEHHS